MWKWIRVSILLMILLSVATGEWLDQRRLWSWKRPASVALYPIAGDSSPATLRYVNQLTDTDYQDLEQFFIDEAHRYGLALAQPVHVEVYRGPASPPPPPPVGARGLAVVWWSLKLRYYAMRSSRLGDGQIRVFVVFHNERRLPSLPHSLGLQRGHIGVVHAFATPDMAGSNNVVVAHEILHALGATDRYDPATNLPLTPAGFGDPAQVPLYPQAYAEIMAGRRLLAPGNAETPRSLSDCLIGGATAAEIHWIRG